MTKEQAHLIRKMRATQITHSMMAEIISIIIAKASNLLTFCAPTWGIASRNQPPKAVLTTIVYTPGTCTLCNHRRS